MNQSPPSSTYDCLDPSITRRTPSAPIPAYRSHRNRTSPASRSPWIDPSGSGNSTKSFSVPCPFNQGNVPVLIQKSSGPPSASIRGWVVHVDRFGHQDQL